MMEEQLNALLEKINHKIELEACCAKWKADLPALRQQVDLLHAAMLEEQNDVDKLEAGGIGTMLHKLTGRMEEKLDKERLEAETAVNQYTEAACALAELETRISQAELELEDLQSCQSQYIQIMQDRINQLESTPSDPDHPDQDVSRKLLLQLERRRKSLREAKLECDHASRCAQENMELLSRSRKRLLENSEPLDLSKVYNHAQILLDSMMTLQAKLAQMGIDPEPHILIDAYLRAPEAFLAGAISDCTPEKQIQKAIRQIDDLNHQIIQIDEKLSEALFQIEARLSQCI